jgi:UbiD family decarboxylase
LLPTIPHSLSRWKRILGQAMFSKCIVVVDEEVDVQNVGEVAWKALNILMSPEVNSRVVVPWKKAGL